MLAWRSVLSRLFLAVIPSLMLGGCGRETGWYPVPAQQSLDLGGDPDGVGPAVKMSDADADDYIVRDIGYSPGTWRWAFRHPELRFRVPRGDGWRLVADIAIPEVTFRVTGAAGISYFVDGRRLGMIRCDHAGQYAIDKPVPNGWLIAGPYIHVSFDADRRWISPDDGAELSFLVSRVGFEP